MVLESHGIDTPNQIGHQPLQATRLQVEHDVQHPHALRPRPHGMSPSRRYPSVIAIRGRGLHPRSLVRRAFSVTATYRPDTKAAST